MKDRNLNLHGHLLCGGFLCRFCILKCQFQILFLSLILPLLYNTTMIHAWYIESRTILYRTNAEVRRGQVQGTLCCRGDRENGNDAGFGRSDTSKKYKGWQTTCWWNSKVMMVVLLQLIRCYSVATFAWKWRRLYNNKSMSSWCKQERRVRAAYFH
jgi:hypothetical protein